jgi:hypothetical protein
MILCAMLKDWFRAMVHGEGVMYCRTVGYWCEGTTRSASTAKTWVRRGGGALRFAAS